MPNAVLNYLARFGWSYGDQEIFSKEELVEAFSWEGCGRPDGKFDAQKFLAINHEHLKSGRLVSDKEYVERLLPFLEARGLVVETASVARALPTIRERARTFVDAAEMLDFFFRPEPVFDVKAASKFLTEDAATNLVGL